MSKIIKSSNSFKENKNSKTIGVKKISFPSQIRKDSDESTISSLDTDIHYLERDEILKQAEEESNRIINEAKEKIEAWQNDLETYQLQIENEAQKRFEEAVEQGQRQGYEAGIVQGKEEYVTEILKAKDIVSKANDDYYKHMEESEMKMLDLSINIAKKIVGKALDTNEGAWLQLVRDAIIEVRGHKDVKVFVHPKWYEITLQHHNELKQAALHTNDLYVYPDTSVAEDGCIIETPFGQVDASLDSQLKEMKRVLLEKLNEGQSNEV